MTLRWPVTRSSSTWIEWGEGSGDEWEGMVGSVVELGMGRVCNLGTLDLTVLEPV